MSLNKEKFIPLFGTWGDKLSPHFSLLEPVYEELKELSRREKKIYPAWENTFKAFEKTNVDEINAVVCGICPYHSSYKGEIVADGLALSCSNTMELQPSLVKWYEGLEKEYKVKSDRNPNLDFLAEQGILLFNMALTVQDRMALVHNELWRPFIKAV